MAGGNRYKHRSLGGGLVPNNQQAPSNNFYVAPPPEPSMLEKALQLAQALGEASSEFTGKANADPGNRLSPFGAVPTQFIKDSAKHLWDEKFGLVPAQKAFDAGTALADILSGKEQSTPFASAQGTQLAGDVANNATVAALDASTLIPGMGVVPKMGKGSTSALEKALSGVKNEMNAMDAVRSATRAETPQGAIGFPTKGRFINDLPEGEFVQRVRVQFPQDTAGLTKDEVIDWAGMNGMIGPDPAPRPSADILPFGRPPSDTTLGMGFPFGGKDGEKPLSRALLDMFKGKPKESPLDQFTPPTTLDDIFTGGAPRGPRELTGGPTNPAGMDGSAFNLNTPEVPYDPAKGFGGLDAKFAADKNARTLSEALAKRAKPLGYDDWSPEWRAAYDKGLPMDTASRMARAREQGFNVDEPSFHATRTDFNEMQPGSGGQLGPGVYFAKAPETTVDYAVKGARDPADAVSWIKRNKGQPVPPELMYDFDGGRTMKLATRGNLAGEDQYQKIFSRYANVDKLPRAQAEARAVEDLRAMGYDGVSSPFLDHHSVFDPANIRSTSAAFDPANAGKPTLLGMGAPFEGKPKGMDPFWDDRLGPSLNKAVEMKRNGFSHAEIEDEMGLAPGTAAAYLARARSTLGADTVPKTVGVKPNATQDTILALYQKGLSNAQIAERASVIHGRTISPNTVKVQISQAKSKGLIEPIKRQTNLGVPAEDLVKALMAYGAFGGMSAGALATMDAQKHQQGGM